MMRKKSFRTELPVNASYPSGSRLSVSEERVQGECANPFSRRSVFISVFFSICSGTGGIRGRSRTPCRSAFLQRDFFMLAAPDFLVTGSRKKILYFRLLFHKENRQTDFLYIRLSNGRSAALCRKGTRIASYPNLVPASYFLRRSIQKYAGNNAENSNDVLIQYRIVNMRTDCNYFRSATFFCIKYMVIVKLYEKRFKNISSDFYI